MIETPPGLDRAGRLLRPAQTRTEILPAERIARDTLFLKNGYSTEISLAELKRSALREPVLLRNAPCLLRHISTTGVIFKQ